MPGFVGYKFSRVESPVENVSRSSRYDVVDTLALAMLTFAISGVLWNALLGPIAARPVAVVLTTVAATAFFVVEQSTVPTTVRLGPET